jgi:hypothetical protein
MLSRGTVTKTFDVDIKFLTESKLGGQFIALDLKNFQALVENTFSRADAWGETHSQRQPEVISSRLVELSNISFRGYTSLFIYITRYCKAEYPSLFSLVHYLTTYLPKNPRYV